MSLVESLGGPYIHLTHLIYKDKMRTQMHPLNTCSVGMKRRQLQAKASIWARAFFLASHTIVFLMSDFQHLGHREKDI